MFRALSPHHVDPSALLRSTRGSSSDPRLASRLAEKQLQETETTVPGLLPQVGKGRCARDALGRSG